jgi:RimJ/RimL family protein N-acetyltransferase
MDVGGGVSGRDAETTRRRPGAPARLSGVLTVDTPLTTERLSLRPYNDADVDDAYAFLSVPDVVRYLYWEVRTRDEVRALLADRARLHTLAAEGDRLVLAVERRSDHRVIGEVNLHWTSEPHRQGETGFVFHPEAQGQGYAREAATRMLDLAFDDLGLHRVCAHTDGRNTASAGLLTRLGMRQEALLREAEIFKGEYGDELVYAVLEDEWRGVRAADAAAGSARSNHRTSQ